MEFVKKYWPVAVVALVVIILVKRVPFLNSLVNGSTTS